MANLPYRNRLRSFLGRSHRLSILRQREQFLAAAKHDCQRQQVETLQGLLKLNEGTQFTKDFGLRPGMTIAEFQRQVPVAGFELIQPYVEKVKNGQHLALLGGQNKLLMFAMTSGTTAESKLIPVTERFVGDYRRGWQTWGIGLYFDYPSLQALNMVQIASSHNRFLAPDGTPCGNISGLVAAMQSRIIRSMYSVPANVANVDNSDLKRYAALKFAVEDPFVGMVITANPSTVVQMMELLETKTESLLRDIHDGTMGGCGEFDTTDATRFLRRSPNKKRAAELQRILAQHGSLRPESIWPHLVSLGVWCGGSAAAYLPRLREWFPDTVIRDHGLHASEGRMTMPLHNDSAAALLEIQTHFFEFLPVFETDSSQPETLLAHELKEGEEYFILLTTSSGLYRYNIQDVVRCTGFYGTTPLLEFRHKGAHISSITGEKIAESQVVEAVQSSAADLDMKLRLFTVTPEWGNPPGYVLYVDESHPGAVNSLHQQSLAAQVDLALCERNVEYREKRETGRLKPIRCERLDRSCWESFTRSRTQRSGGSIEQYKHPCLLPDAQFQDVFRKACGQAATHEPSGQDNQD